MALPPLLLEEIALVRSQRVWRWYPPPVFNCNGKLTDLTFDNANCGACGNACAPSSTCCHRTCVSTSTDVHNCGECGREAEYSWDATGKLFQCCSRGVPLTGADLLGDSGNCGACGNVCDPGYRCSSGHCCPNCTVWSDGITTHYFEKAGEIVAGILSLGGWSSLGGALGSLLDKQYGPGCYTCDQIRELTGANVGCCSQGPCTDLNTDLQHCGACGNPCLAGQTCKDGVCECPPGLPHACPAQGKCVNLGTDVANCGTCGADCQKTIRNKICWGGECQCPFNRPNQCNQIGLCVDLMNDVQNCGWCVHPCGFGEVCCKGECANLQESARHCGTCDTDCTRLGLFLPGGNSTSCCHGQCTDMSSNRNHCGRCDRKCASGEVCVNGDCYEELPVL
jgi:hypothetical protein